MSSLAPSVLRALAYADIFDYPLTPKEIHHWLIGDSNLTQKLSKNYYHLPNRQSLISLRQSRQKWSRQKLALANRVGQWLQYIPYIKLVAVTGALAMNNSDENDDIDLMIITSPNRLWLTRLVVVPLISLFFHRRTPAKSHKFTPSTIAGPHATCHRNAICLNLWLDETALTLPVTQRNLYTAHEVAQIKPIVDRDHTHHKFLSANSWINRYLPNIKVPKHVPVIINYQLPAPRSFSIVGSIINLLENFVFKLQYWYMKPKITRERISPHFAFFHPRNTGRWVMQEYNKRLKKLNVRI